MARSRRGRRRIVAVALAVVLAISPRLAYADHCGSLSDCYGTIAIGLAALIATAALVALVGLLVAEVAAGAAAEALVAEAAAGEAAAAEAAAAPAAAASGAAGEAGATGSSLSSIPIDFNPLRGTTNCGLTTDAVNNWLAGNGVEPAGVGPPQWPTTPGTTPWDFGATPGDIVAQLEASGEGARGIVYVTNGSVAHVFNAFNNVGTVFAIDGQTGAVGSIVDVAAHAGYSGSNVSWGWVFTNLPSFPFPP